MQDGKGVKGVLPPLPTFLFLPTCQAVTDGAKHGTLAVTAKTTKLLNVNVRETNHRN